MSFLHPTIEVKKSAIEHTMNKEEKIEYIKSLNRTLDNLLRERDFDNVAYQLVKTKLISFIRSLNTDLITSPVINYEPIKPDIYWGIEANKYKVTK